MRSPAEACHIGCLGAAFLLDTLAKVQQNSVPHRRICYLQRIGSWL